MGKVRGNKRRMVPGGTRTPAPGARPTHRGYGPTSSTLFALVVLTVLSGLIYMNALQNKFVFDDYDLVVENRQIRSLSRIPEILGFGDSPRRYRPVRFVSYSLDYFFFGLDPRGYHLANVVYHIITSFLVYLIIWQILRNLNHQILPLHLKFQLDF